MVVRIHNVSKWKCLQPGEYLELPGNPDGREIVLQVNCPAPTRVDLLVKDTPTFLAVVQGLETVRFFAAGTAEVTFTSGGETGGAEVWYFTDDAGEGAVENVAAVSFTKLANRRTRNPQLELMMLKLEQNALRREELLRDELSQARAAVAAKEAASAVSDGASAAGPASTTGTADSAAAQPAAGADDGKPATA